MRRPNFLHAYRPGTPTDETANATIAPTTTTSGHKTVDIEDFHVAHSHAHEGALKNTAKQMGANLEGEMHECKGFSMAKGLRMSIPKKMDNRAVKSRVFEDLGGKRRVASVGRNKYPMIMRDDFSRYACD